MRLVAAIPVDDPLKAALRLRNVVLSAPDGVAFPTRVIDGQLAIEVKVADLRIGTGPPIQPGDTGTVTIFMDNPEPVLAFRLVVKTDAAALRVIRVDGLPRLPPDAHVAFTDLGAGSVQIIVSSFSQSAIAAGSGAIVSLTYQVADTAAEGLVRLVLDEVALTDRRGRTLRQATVAGHFPVGSIVAVFTPAASDGQPGRTVTVPLNLANQVALCGFRFEVQHDPKMLDFLSLETDIRLPGDLGLGVHEIEPGLLQVEYDGPQPIAVGDGPLLSLVFSLVGSVPWDTSLAVVVSRVDAEGCPSGPVFALGQAGRVTIGAAPAQPVHFLTDRESAGGIHFITAQAVTMGGRYLDQGDEVAVIDTSGGGSAAGVVVMGVGVVRADGSVDIPARLGFADGRGLPAGAASGLGRAMVFLAWDRQADQESRPGAEARYVLGAGLWGENNGLTIIDLLQLPALAAAPVSRLPDRLVVEQNVPNPFTDTTVIRFSLPVEQQVRVAVYDLLGRELVALHDGITAGGYHQVTWDGTDGQGRPARKGMWFYQVRTPEGAITRKMLLLR
ncbi:MAG: T9SS type A sorting domain-containing protein [Candidatus Marinimicrobia bacterium]|nr:T9SS type A sorting domain-containing protein [Candidatus Neomarinimicrobiota bacterium]